MLMSLSNFTEQVPYAGGPQWLAMLAVGYATVGTLTALLCVRTQAAWFYERSRRAEELISHDLAFLVALIMCLPLWPVLLGGEIGRMSPGLFRFRFWRVVWAVLCIRLRHSRARTPEQHEQAAEAYQAMLISTLVDVRNKPLGIICEWAWLRGAWHVLHSSDTYVLQRLWRLDAIARDGYTDWPENQDALAKFKHAHQHWCANHADAVADERARLEQARQSHPH